MSTKIIKVSCVVFLIISFGVLGYFYNNMREISYNDGYREGFKYGKELVEKVLKHEYQNFIYLMAEELYNNFKAFKFLIKIRKKSIIKKTSIIKFSWKRE